jgi:hypothetical protein
MVGVAQDEPRNCAGGPGVRAGQHMALYVSIVMAMVACPRRSEMTVAGMPTASAAVA